MSRASQATEGRPQVSVIIPVRDDAARLEVCLASLERQTLGIPFEVLVIDNGSQDDVDGVVRRHALARLLREQRRSSYAARNRGVSVARGAVLAFTDSDCVPAPDWLERGLARLDGADERIFVGGRVETFPQDPARPTPAEIYERIHAFPQRSYVEWLSFSVTANMFVRAQVFRSVGSFTEQLQSSGDREWGQRAWDAGVRPVYAPEVVVEHPCRRTIGELNRKTRRLYAGDSQLRSLRGSGPRPFELVRLVRPPLRSSLRNLGRVEPPTTRARLTYLATAVLVHYMSGVYRAQAALRERRTARSGGAAPEATAN